MRTLRTTWDVEITAFLVACGMVPVIRHIIKNNTKDATPDERMNTYYGFAFTTIPATTTIAGLFLRDGIGRSAFAGVCSTAVAVGLCEGVILAYREIKNLVNGALGSPSPRR